MADVSKAGSLFPLTSDIYHLSSIVFHAMLRVGLTGSIAVGKSFVMNRFAELGCRTCDADQIARFVVEPGSVGLEKIVAEFGRGVLADDGSLDRARLGSVVFGDTEQRARLNSILHPLIIEEQDRILGEWAADDPAGIAIVEAALMIESGSYRRFDRIIAVHCREEVQSERLIRRNGLSRDEAERRIRAQMAQSEKMMYADHLIDTSGTTVETLSRTDEVYEALRDTAARSGTDADGSL